MRAANTYGTTALHVAAEFGADAVFEALLAAGADPTARDKCGRTPGELRVLRGSRLRAATTVITDETFLQHHTCDPDEATSPAAPPENTHRVTVLVDPLQGVLRGSDLASLRWEEGSPMASVADVLRVHEWSYG